MAKLVFNVDDVIKNQRKSDIHIRITVQLNSLVLRNLEN